MLTLQLQIYHQYSAEGEGHIILPLMDGEGHIMRQHVLQFILSLEPLIFIVIVSFSLRSHDEKSHLNCIATNNEYSTIFK